jgi:hypothetical protein
MHGSIIHGTRLEQYMYCNNLISCETDNFPITNFLTTHSSHHNFDQNKKNRSVYMIDIAKLENNGWYSLYEQVDQGLCSP